jgi:hypothetical protein
MRAGVSMKSVWHYDGSGCLGDVRSVRRIVKEKRDESRKVSGTCDQKADDRR